MCNLIEMYTVHLLQLSLAGKHIAYLSVQFLRTHINSYLKRRERKITQRRKKTLRQKNENK